MDISNIHPEILTDKSRLQEIYDLRVLSWERSPQGHFINKLYFPHGWRDKYDEQACHWVIENEKAIIASARVCVLDNVEEMDECFSHFCLPKERPFAFFSRLVVHPAHRGKGISKLMDYARLKFVRDNDISFTLASVEHEIGRNEVLKSLGFKGLGNFIHHYGENPIPKTCKAFILFQSDINL